MSIYMRLRYRLVVVGMMLVVLFSSFGHAARAIEVKETVDWFGWGVNVDFQNNTWKVIYTTYLGSNVPTPHVVAEDVRDISAQCTKRGLGNLTYPTPDSAYFDGTVYIQCNLPSVRSALIELGYTPPGGDQPFCPCTLGGGPLWVAGQFRQLTESGTMPVLDASARGLRMSLQVNGASAQTKLEVKRPNGSLSYSTPPWTIDAAGDRTLAGWDGDGIVAVADHFGWLKYLDSGWRPFFNIEVSGNKIGYWNEPIIESGTSALNGNYELGMNSGSLYIGYSPATGKYFTGEIDEADADPGCSGA